MFRTWTKSWIGHEFVLGVDEGKRVEENRGRLKWTMKRRVVEWVQPKTIKLPKRRQWNAHMKWYGYKQNIFNSFLSVGKCISILNSRLDLQVIQGGYLNFATIGMSTNIIIYQKIQIGDCTLFFVLFVKNTNLEILNDDFRFQT